MTPPACIVCDGESWTLLERGLQRCERCGFARAQVIPDADELARLYGAAYFSGEEYADYVGDRDVHRANFRRRLKRITAVAGRPESMFEIGCAYGFWLQVLAEHGIRAAGIDISVEPVRHAAEALGMYASRGSFEDVQIERGLYQSYCMWDTLEHLAHPEAYVAKAADLLPSGGWFFATTGDIGSPLARQQGMRWRMIHPPTHLQYFSRETVTRFLSRHGLQTVHIESVPMCRSVHGTLEGLKLFDRGALRGAAQVLSRIVPRAATRRMRFWVDLGDIMLVCARKA